MNAAGESGRGREPKRRVCDASSSDHCDPWAIEPMPRELFDSPLDFLFADHHRQRQAVRILLNIAAGAWDETGGSDLITFLERDFALHIQDEECDFVPLLRRICPPEDGIDVLAERLADEHADDRSSVQRVIAILRKRLQGEPLSRQAQESIRDFAAHLRQHLAIENSVLLPIARVRMDAESLTALSKAMRNRRGGHMS